MNIEGIDASLRENIFQPELTIKGFVENDSSCNYEFYLLELVNSSEYFLRKLLRGNYLLTECQSHAECDCIGDGYELDFKMMESTTMLRARSIFSIRKIQLLPGVVLDTKPKVTQVTKGYRPIRATILHKALRQCSLSDLERLRAKNKGDSPLEKDILDFLKILETSKNILLLNPYKLYFMDKTYDLESGSKQITKLLWNDLHTSMEYRRKVCPDKETFLTFLYNDTFVLLEYRDDLFACVDYIPKTKMKTFCYLEALRL